MDEETQQIGNRISSQRRMVIFATLVITCVTLSLQSTAMTTALAPLVADLGISLSAGQWVTSGYTLVLAVMMPFSAFPATRIPTRQLYLGTLACFLAGSVACALAPSFWLLMVGRGVQASANAVVANVTQVSIMHLYPADQRGRAMGWFGLSVSAAPIAAPALGGLLVDLWGWRAMFWGIALLGLLSLVSALFVMENTLETAPKPFDGTSFVLSLAAFGGLTLGLGNVVALGVTAPGVWAPFVVGALAGVPFVRRQLKSQQPFLKVQILGTPAFCAACLASMFLYGVTMGAAAVLPLQVQQAMGQGAAISGLVILPGAAATALVSPMAGRLFDRWGAMPLAFAGAALMAVSCLVTCIPAVADSLVGLGAANTVRCLAVGCLTMPLTTWANASVLPEDMPHASALLTSLRNLAGSLGVAMFVGLFDAAGLVVCFVALAVVSLAIAPCVALGRARRS